MKGGSAMNMLTGYVSCWLVLPVLVVMSIVYRESLSNIMHLDTGNGYFEGIFRQDSGHGGKNNSESANRTIDKLLGGLLAPDFDERTCLSRYNSASYRTPSPHTPSPYLIQKLRKYEELHRKCGPNTNLYKLSMDQLKSGLNNTIMECNYIIWKPDGGLGNRILVLASAFLYALLTDRVLLIERGRDMDQLFCEPFPNTSWLLPLDFPLMEELKSLNKGSPKSFGNLVTTGSLSGSKPTFPNLAFVFLAHTRSYHDMLFFCEKDQLLIQKIPLLVFQSNIYFVPSLFLIPSFHKEINQLFPKKEAIFHHLGRYLFHPSNRVWGLIIRFYQDYLVSADHRVGIQVRIFGKEHGPVQSLLDQILACTQRNNILPKVTYSEQTSIGASLKRKAVFVTSLSSWYYEKMREIYWEESAIGGEYVGVFQASHEEFQQTDKQMHDMKAWAEIYLLSLSDVLVTSSGSTFGYVANGLAGIRPWLLAKPDNQTMPEPPCLRMVSMEPCLHASPSDCRGKIDLKNKTLSGDVMQCEDVSFGVKLLDGHTY